MPFEILEHPADIGFAVSAGNPATLFSEAARALAFIAFDTSAVTATETRSLAVSGDDYPSLLVNFLEELVFLFDAGLFAPSVCVVSSIDERQVRAELHGESRVPARHPWKLIVKAVTYHDLEVAERDGQWRARVFLDI